MNDNELYHYGVKGMKWGVRKFQEKSEALDRKKASYKKAKKAYSKSFNKAYNRSLAAYSPLKKHRQANEKRWSDAQTKAEALKKAKSEYKSAKKELRQNATVGQKIGRGAKKTAGIMVSIGQIALADQLATGGAGRKLVVKGAKYLKNKALDKMFNTSVLDAAGKVIYRYNS